MSKTSKAKDASYIPKMEIISKNLESAWSDIDLTNPPKTSTKPEEEVAVADISPIYSKMSTFKKEMGNELMAVSTHPVLGMRQIRKCWWPKLMLLYCLLDLP